MINQYLPLLIIFILAAALGFLVVLIGVLFGPKRPSKRKASPYESGMTPFGPGQRRISIRYYLVAVLFILFDVETIFFLPWAVVFRQLKVFGLIEMFIFIGILVVGYIYAWKKGAFEWE